MTFLRECTIVFNRQLRMNLRNPAWVIIGMLQPVLYVLLFGPLLKPLISQFGATNAYTFFVPGMLVQALILVGLGYAMGMRAGFVGVVVGVALTLLIGGACAAASNTLALATKSEDVMAPVVNMVMVPVLLLSGILLPMTIGPRWLQRSSDFHADPVGGRRGPDRVQWGVRRVGDVLGHRLGRRTVRTGDLVGYLDVPQGERLTGPGRGRRTLERS